MKNLKSYQKAKNGSNQGVTWEIKARKTGYLL
jgi:hypothetical protein